MTYMSRGQNLEVGGRGGVRRGRGVAGVFISQTVVSVVGLPRPSERETARAQGAGGETTCCLRSGRPEEVGKLCFR